MYSGFRKMLRIELIIAIVAIACAGLITIAGFWSPQRDGPLGPWIKSEGVVWWSLIGFLLVILSFLGLLLFASEDLPL